MSENLAETYGTFFEQGKNLRVEAGESAIAKLRADKVPKELLRLVPYAAFWGIADDSYRIALIERAPEEIWRRFQEMVNEHKRQLLEWLAGPEADLPPTPEYLAFSFMLQAFDWPRGV